VTTEEARERDGLVQAYLDDLLSDPEADRLRELLEADEAHLDALICAVDLEGVLVSVLRGTSEVPSLRGMGEVPVPRGRTPEASPSDRARSARTRRSGWFSREHAWQAVMAAALLIAVVGVLGFPAGSDHVLVGGRAWLEDGRELQRGERLRASEPWALRTSESASLRLADGSTVELRPGSALDLRPAGRRGAEARLGAGRARVVVAPGRESLRISSPTGWVESVRGSFELKLTSEREEGEHMRKGRQPMKGMITAAIVTVLAGSASVGNARGILAAEPGSATVLSAAEPPLAVAAAQDAEALLKRLEELSSAIAKLEEKVQHLEARNKQLKDQLNAAGGAPGAVPPGGAPLPGASAPGAVPPGGVPAPGAVPPGGTPAPGAAPGAPPK
jgi:ferric-dicitrate binding protein FerR (iron transport regulator)